jgi:hypothetical protein
VERIFGRVTDPRLNIRGTHKREQEVKERTNARRL